MSGRKFCLRVSLRMIVCVYKGILLTISLIYIHIINYEENTICNYYIYNSIHTKLMVISTKLLTLIHA